VDFFTGKSILACDENMGKRVVFLLFPIVLLFFPSLVLVLMGILAKGMLSKRIGQSFFAITFVSFVASYNATRLVDADWYWYATHYIKMTEVSLLDYLQEGELSVRSTEPLYYAMAYTLSLLSDGNVLILVIAVTALIYLTYNYALERLMKLNGLHQWAAAICIVFALLVGITFSQTLHLVRQYIAGSLLFFFFVLVLERRYKAAVILFVLGMLTHNSFIVPGLLMVICAYLWSLPFVRKRFISILIILVCTGYLIGLQIADLVLEDDRQAVTAFLDNGDVTWIVLLQDIFLFFISVAGVVFLGKLPGYNTRASAISVLFLALFGGMLIGGREMTLFFLRFYFYVEWFRVISVITIVWYLVYRTKATNLVILLIPLWFLGFSMRVSHSPWDYGGDFFEHLTQSVSWWVNQITIANDNF
jgi:hypothetical protein